MKIFDDNGEPLPGSQIKIIVIKEWIILLLIIILIILAFFCIGFTLGAYVKIGF